MKAHRRSCISPLILIPLLFSSSSSAFCVDQNIATEPLYRFKLGGSKHGQPIPVYVVTSGVNSVSPDVAKTAGTSGTAFTSDIVIEQVKSALRAVAESSPEVRPYFAAAVNSDGTAREGITLLSTDSFTDSTHTEKLIVSPGVTGAVIHIKPADTRVGTVPHLVWSTEPPDDGAPNGTESLKANILHELGHAFGLNHLSDPCEVGKYTDDPNHCSSPGCQSAFKSVLNAKREYLTADDIQGITYNFGSRYRTIDGWSSSDGFVGNWVHDVSFRQSLVTTLPPVVSGLNGDFAGSGGSVIAYTDSSSLLFIAHDAGAAYGYNYPERVGGPLAVNQTYQRPAVAIGNGFIVVSWFDESVKTQPLAPRRIAIKNLSTGAWSEPFPAVLTGFYPHVTLGYDSFSKRFIIATNSPSDNTAILQTLNPATGVLGTQHKLNVGGSPWTVRNLSKVACKDSPLGSDCMITSDKPSNNSTREFHLYTTSSTVVDDAIFNNTLVSDPMGWNDITYGPSDAFVASYTHNSGTGYVYRLADFGSVDTDNQGFASNFWPLAVGTWSKWTYIPPGSWSVVSKFRMIYAP